MNASNDVQVVAPAILSPRVSSPAPLGSLDKHLSGGLSKIKHQGLKMLDNNGQLVPSPKIGGNPLTRAKNVAASPEGGAGNFGSPGLALSVSARNLDIGNFDNVIAGVERERKPLQVASLRTASSPPIRGPNSPAGRAIHGAPGSTTGSSANRSASAASRGAKDNIINSGDGGSTGTGAGQNNSSTSTGPSGAGQQASAGGGGLFGGMFSAFSGTAQSKTGSKDTNTSKGPNPSSSASNTGKGKGADNTVLGADKDKTGDGEGSRSPSFPGSRISSASPSPRRVKLANDRFVNLTHDSNMEEEIRKLQMSLVEELILKKMDANRDHESGERKDSKGSAGGGAGNASTSGGLGNSSSSQSQSTFVSLPRMWDTGDGFVEKCLKKDHDFTVLQFNMLAHGLSCGPPGRKELAYPREKPKVRHSYTTAPVVRKRLPPSMQGDGMFAPHKVVDYHSLLEGANTANFMGNLQQQLRFNYDPSNPAMSPRLKTPLETARDAAAQGSDVMLFQTKTNTSKETNNQNHMTATSVGKNFDPVQLPHRPELQVQKITPGMAGATAVSPREQIMHGNPWQSEGQLRREELGGSMKSKGSLEEIAGGRHYWAQGYNSGQKNPNNYSAGGGMNKNGETTLAGSSSASGSSSSVATLANHPGAAHSVQQAIRLGNTTIPAPALNPTVKIANTMIGGTPNPGMHRRGSGYLPEGARVAPTYMGNGPQTQVLKGTFTLSKRVDGGAPGTGTPAVVQPLVATNSNWASSGWGKFGLKKSIATNEDVVAAMYPHEVADDEGGILASSPMMNMPTLSAREMPSVRESGIFSSTALLARDPSMSLGMSLGLGVGGGKRSTAGSMKLSIKYETPAMKAMRERREAEERPSCSPSDEEDGDEALPDNNGPERINVFHRGPSQNDHDLAAKLAKQSAALAATHGGDSRGRDPTAPATPRDEGQSVKTSRASRGQKSLASSRASGRGSERVSIKFETAAAKNMRLQRERDQAEEDMKKGAAGSPGSPPRSPGASGRRGSLRVDESRLQVDPVQIGAGAEGGNTDFFAHLKSPANANNEGGPGNTTSSLNPGVKVGLPLGGTGLPSLGGGAAQQAAQLTPRLTPGDATNGGEPKQFVNMNPGWTPRAAGQALNLNLGTQAAKNMEGAHKGAKPKPAMSFPIYEHGGSMMDEPSTPGTIAKKREEYLQAASGGGQNKFAVVSEGEESCQMSSQAEDFSSQNADHATAHRQEQDEPIARIFDSSNSESSRVVSKEESVSSSIRFKSSSSEEVKNMVVAPQAPEESVGSFFTQPKMLTLQGIQTPQSGRIAGLLNGGGVQTPQLSRTPLMPTNIVVGRVPSATNLLAGQQEQGDHHGTALIPSLNIETVDFGKLMSCTPRVPSGSSHLNTARSSTTTRKNQVNAADAIVSARQRLQQNMRAASELACQIPQSSGGQGQSGQQFNNDVSLASLLARNKILTKNQTQSSDESDTTRQIQNIQANSCLTNPATLQQLLEPRVISSTVVSSTRLETVHQVMHGQHSPRLSDDDVPTAIDDDTWAQASQAQGLQENGGQQVNLMEGSHNAALPDYDSDHGDDDSLEGSDDDDYSDDDEHHHLGGMSSSNCCDHEVEREASPLLIGGIMMEGVHQMDAPEDIISDSDNNAPDDNQERFSRLLAEGTHKMDAPEEGRFTEGTHQMGKSPKGSSNNAPKKSQINVAGNETKTYDPAGPTNDLTPSGAGSHRGAGAAADSAKNNKTVPMSVVVANQQGGKNKTGGVSGTTISANNHVVATTPASTTNVTLAARPQGVVVPQLSQGGVVSVGTPGSPSKKGVATSLYSTAAGDPVDGGHSVLKPLKGLPKNEFFRNLDPNYVSTHLRRSVQGLIHGPYQHGGSEVPTPFMHTNCSSGASNNFGDFVLPASMGSGSRVFQDNPNSPRLRGDVSAFDWQTRKLRLLYEVLKADSEVLTLQECDHFHDFFQPVLAELGYEGVFCPKPASACLYTGHYPDGVALFWKKKRFIAKERWQGLPGGLVEHWDDAPSGSGQYVGVTGNPCILVILESLCESEGGITEQDRFESEQETPSGSAVARMKGRKLEKSRGSVRFGPAARGGFNNSSSALLDDDETQEGNKNDGAKTGGGWFGGTKFGGSNSNSKQEEEDKKMLQKILADDSLTPAEKQVKMKAQKALAKNKHDEERAKRAVPEGDGHHHGQHLHGQHGSEETPGGVIGHKKGKLAKRGMTMAMDVLQVDDHTTVTTKSYPAGYVPPSRKDKGEIVDQKISVLEHEHDPNFGKLHMRVLDQDGQVQSDQVLASGMMPGGSKNATSPQHTASQRSLLNLGGGPLNNKNINMGGGLQSPILPGSSMMGMGSPRLSLKSHNFGQAIMMPPSSTISGAGTFAQPTTSADYGFKLKLKKLPPPTDTLSQLLGMPRSSMLRIGGSLPKSKSGSGSGSKSTGINVNQGGNNTVTASNKNSALGFPKLATCSTASLESARGALNVSLPNVLAHVNMQTGCLRQKCTDEVRGVSPKSAVLKPKMGEPSQKKYRSSIVNVNGTV